ncbi:hypothetical protein TVAG_211510 [Trichomonas vaginalis G3]|uniref:Sec1 family protein n=1 Tax=Trichomonas vaginalis (strain ATCC PRA-98 / G3) TaxID=412133 RepID=A2EKZ1_TRIV3|nr:Sec1 family [Trichomonas vaginalis G3]EAY06699.1 hypothetical protein TVAG_211510 [Trichomonas vaginalis G3]KAI5491700.1 Sec1 family [Trichomonas vaginalis G3]|eukprot:XP_001318922.1 hypothetical protein [Trichomonas vaginalis G3]
MNDKEWWQAHILKAATAALSTISKIYIGCPVYVDPIFYFFLKYVKDLAKLDKLDIFPLANIMQTKRDNDMVIVLGSPGDILTYTNNISQKAEIIFLTVPIPSISFKFNIMAQPFNPIKYDGWPFPFVPRKKCLLMPIGTFTDFYLSNQAYQTKALKAGLAILAHIFGGFNRVYGIGTLSSKVASGFLDAMPPNIERCNNNLILLDRTLDLLTQLRFNETYIGFMEELIPFDEFDLEITPPQQMQVFNRRTPATTNDDDLFEDIAVRTIPEVRRRLNVMGISNSLANDIKNTHTDLLNKMEQLFKENYPKALLFETQNGLVSDPFTQSRILALDKDSYELAFRALTILRSKGDKTAENYARFLGQALGVQSVARWTRIDEFLTTAVSVSLPTKAKAYCAEVGALAAIFATIITDEWKRSKFPVSPNYISTQTPVMNEPQRWFVVIPGGLCAAELAAMRVLARNIRPTDQFVFIPTNMQSPSGLMSEIIRK